MRDLDVPLRKIADVLEARDPAVTERVLAEHTRAIQQRLDDTLRIIGQLQRGIDEPSLHTPLHILDEPLRHALLCDGRIGEEGFATFLDQSFAMLAEVVLRVQAQAVDVAGALYGQEIVDDDGEEVTAYLPIAEPVHVPSHVGVRLGEVPAARVAVAVHLGGYEDLDDTYRHLGRWVAINAVPRPGSVRERYLVSSPSPEHEYCTEIQWPVEAPSLASR